MKKFNLEELSLGNILAIIHFLSPLLIALLIGDFLNTQSMQFSFLGKLAVCSFAMFALFAVLTAGGIKKVKTGKSFRTKSGASFDEYKDEHTPGLDISNLHAGIGLIHLAFSIIVGIYKLSQSVN
ncbi:MAG: hypothetical protein ACI93P_001685 [bacterium]|jgi:hypothetical protein